MKGLILVGGKGTRLRPLTYFFPKPMLSMVNRPFLEYEIELLRDHGVKDIILCSNYMSEKIQGYFGDGEKWDVKLTHLVEEKTLGTAGAIKNAERCIGDNPVVVLNGDILTNIDLSKMIRDHSSKSAKVTIAVEEVEDPSSYGLITQDTKGHVTRFLEKPGIEEISSNTVNAGIYIIDPGVLRHIPPGREVSIEREVFPKLLDLEIPIYGSHGRDDYWLDIGTWKKYIQAHFDIMGKKIKAKITGEEIMPGVWVGKDVEIHPTALINPPVVFDSRVKIGPGSKVGPNVIIGYGTEISAGTNISDTVIQRRCKIGKSVTIKGSVIDFGVLIQDDCVLGNLVIGAESVVSHGSRMISSC